MSLFINIIIYFISLLYINRFTDNSIFKILPLALYFASILRVIILYNGRYPSILLNNHSKSSMKPIWAILVLLLIGLIRSSNPLSTNFSQINSIINILLFTLFILSVYCEIIYSGYNFVKSYEKIAILFIIYPFFLYTLINIIFWALDITPGKEEEEESLNIGESVLLSITGLSFDRIKFPFASGINSFAVVISGVLSMIISYIFVSKKHSIINYIISFTLLFTIILTDSRSALIYPIVSCGLVAFINKSNSTKLVRIFPYVFFFGPIIMATLLPLLSQINFFEQLSRNSEDLLTGNARFFIWGASVNKLLSFDLIHLIGYGQYGHYASGASSAWSTLFNKYENYMAVHPHNSALSILFDYGYLGAVFFFFFLKSIANKLTRLWKTQQNFCIIAASFYIYFILISITETFFGPYYVNSMYLTLSVFILIFIVDYTEQYKLKPNKYSHDRHFKIHPITHPSSSGTASEGSAIYSSMVQLEARAEK